MAAALILNPPALHAPAVAGSPDLIRFIADEAEVETGGRWRKVGKKGELGAYQFTRITWHSYTDMPFRFAADPRVAPTIALMHAQRIAGALRHVGVLVTARNLALVWKCGMKNFLAGNISPSSKDHAERVQNLYDANHRR